MIFNFIKIFLIIILAIICIPFGYFILEENNSFDETKMNFNIDNTTNGKVISYIVNLDRSRDRYEYISANVEKLGFDFERFSAVDGSSLSNEDIEKYVDLEYYKITSRKYPRVGAIGCSLSHIRIWKKFLESDYDYALIFEDDVSFDPQIIQNTVDELITYNDLWDVVTFVRNHHGFPITKKEMSNNLKFVSYLSELKNSGGYIINRNAAAKMLGKSLPIKLAIDNYFARSWEFGLKFRGIEPIIVKQTFGTSEIDKTDRANDVKFNFFDEIKKKTFKIQTILIRFIYNLYIHLS